MTFLKNYRQLVEIDIDVLNFLSVKIVSKNGRRTKEMSDWRICPLEHEI